MQKYLGVLAAGMLTLPAVSFAATPTIPTISELLSNSGISVSGHLGASYVYGFNKGSGSSPGLAYRAFDTNPDSFTFNQAWLDISRLPSSGVGGEVTLLAGSDATAVNGAYGSGGNSDFSLVQAYLQYSHGAFTIMGGRYLTLSGAEVIDDSQDTNISRSFLFQLVEPLVHTGIRTSYALTDATFYLGVNNGIYTGNASDTNHQKTIEAGVSLTPSSSTSLGIYEYYSHEGQAGLSYLDFVGSYQATSKLSFVLNGDWFSQHSAVNGPAYAYGLAAYANYTFSPKWTGSLRGEVVKTKNIAQNLPPSGKATLSEVTATVGYAPVPSLKLLGELRYDMGDKVYPQASATNPYTDTQGNVAVEAVYSF